VVRVEELSPTTVAQLLRAPRRADDVGEQQRHQHTVGTRSRPRSREELLYLVDDLVRVDIRDVIVTGQSTKRAPGMRSAM